VLGAGAGADITTSGNGGNHMVYGLVGGIAGAMAVAGGAYYFMSGGKKKSKKSKRGVGVDKAKSETLQEAPAQPAPSSSVAVTPGFEQYQGVSMYPMMGQQAHMTPVPQLLVLTSSGLLEKYSLGLVGSRYSLPSSSGSQSQRSHELTAASGPRSTHWFA
ncbi:unnamed protein product, partial [Symbiodinium necroappetens]